MNESDIPRSTNRPLLDEQLRLIEERRRDVADLLMEPGVVRDEALVDNVANDLAGARLVIRAALAAPPPGGISGAAREELRNREREAGDLLRAVLAVPAGV